MSQIEVAETYLGIARDSFEEVFFVEVLESLAELFLQSRFGWD